MHPLLLRSQEENFIPSELWKDCEQLYVGRVHEIHEETLLYQFHKAQRSKHALPGPLTTDRMVYRPISETIHSSPVYFLK
jgi:hypothetical protein